MDQRSEIREFLASRRARITPGQAGLPAYGVNRRVPGLRREEVALLAGVSVDYYTQMERGNLGGVSDGVLDALAGALQLDEAERSHLLNLARTATTSIRARPRSGPERVRPSVQRLLDAMTAVPAYVRTGRLDILGVNRLGQALYAPVLAGQQLPVNLARFLFLDPAPATSMSTGTRPPMTRWPSCAAKPAATPMTGGCRTWSGSCPPAARSSGPGGERTTCGCTAAAASSSTIPWSATSS
jgi:transcriptional regulator with XRE-family HTH domain